MRMLWTLLLLCGGAFVSPALESTGTWLAEVPIDGTTVQIRLRAPLHPTTACPVIIMSHGLGGSRDGYVSATTAWAEAGYAVIQPTHPGSDTDSLRSVFTERGQLAGRKALRAAATDPQVALSRPRLVATLIEHLAEVRASVPGFTGSFDGQRIGVAGHSFGAWTALAVAGAPLTATPGPGPLLSHPKPLAFIAMSPPGPKPDMDRPEQWSDVTRPVLMLSGTEDKQPSLLNISGEERGMAWRIKSFDLLPLGDSALSILTGAHHSAFSDGAGAVLTKEPPPEPWMAPAIASVTTMWWNAWLRADPAAIAAVRGSTAVPEHDRQRMTWKLRR